MRKGLSTLKCRLRKNNGPADVRMNWSRFSLCHLSWREPPVLHNPFRPAFTEKHLGPESLNKTVWRRKAVTNDLQNSKVFWNDLCWRHKLNTWKGVIGHLRIWTVQFERWQPEAISGNANCQLVKYVQGITHLSKHVTEGQEKKMREVVYSSQKAHLTDIFQFSSWIDFVFPMHKNLHLPRKMLDMDNLLVMSTWRRHGKVSFKVGAG